MARAVRVMTVERGLDPREFVLLAFGGAGPMHACELAEQFGIRRRARAARAGCHLGARDALRRRRPRSRPGEHRPLALRSTRDAVETLFRELEAAARAALDDDHVAARAPACSSARSTSATLGQLKTLPVAVPTSALDAETIAAACARASCSEYERRYHYVTEEIESSSPSSACAAAASGAAPELPRASAEGAAPHPSGAGPLRRRAARPRPSTGAMTWRRRSGSPGPLIVDQLDTTTVVPPGSDAACRRARESAAWSVTTDERPAAGIDPITFQVLNNAFSLDRRRDGRARAELRLLARRQRRARLQRDDLHRGRRPGRLRRDRPARAPRHDPLHGQGHARVDRRAEGGVLPRPATSSSSTTPTSAARTTTTSGSSCRCSQKAGSSPSSRTPPTGPTSAATCRARSTRTRAARTARA